MKPAFLFIFVSTLLLGLSGPAAAAPGDQVKASSVQSAYKIDGHLTEPFWKSLQWHDSFHTLKSKDSPLHATRFAVGVTEDAVLIGIVAEVDPSTAARSGTQDAPSTTALVGYGKEPGIELFIAPSADADQYGQWYLTTAGLANDIWRKAGTGSGGLSTWRSQAEVGSEVRNGEWTLELAIPLASLKLEPLSANGKWRIMVGRVHPKDGGRPVTYSTNAPLSDNFHELANYVPLDLDHRELDDFLWSLRPISDGEITQNASGSLVYEVEVETLRQNKQGPAWQTIQLTGTLDSSAGPIESNSVIALAPNRPEPITLSFALPAGALTSQSTLQLSVATKEQPKRVLAAHAQDVPMLFEPVSVRLTQPAYRNSIYATQNIEAIEAQVTLAIGLDALEGATLTASLRAEGDDTPAIATQEIIVDASKLALRLELEDELAVGNYRLDITVSQPGGETWQASQTLRRLASTEHEWRIDENKALLRNGEPFLPYGWFGWKERDDPATAGINTTFVYHLPNEGIEKTLVWMDRMAAEGVVCLVDPWPASLYRKNQKNPLSVAEETQLRQYVRRLRDHKALMAYYMYDEPEYVPVLPERLERAFEIIQEEDPYHPCVILNMQFNAIAQYADSADIIMPDTYPSFRDNMGPISGIHKIAKHLKESARVADGKQAVWLTPQAFEWDEQTPAARAPNFLELRNQQVQGIVYGSRGFIWWVYGRQLNDKNLELGIPFLGREAERLKSAIMSADTEFEIETDANDPTHMHTAVRQVGDHFFVFVVNTSPDDQGTVTFRLPSLDTRRLHVVSEARDLRVSGGAWRDSFDGYSAHIYTTDESFSIGQTVKAVQQRIDESLSGLQRPGNLAFRGTGATIETSPHINWGAFPKRLNDGYVGRSWQAQQGQEPSWVQVNFTDATKVGRIVAHTNATNYEVQIRKDEQWATVATGQKPADTPIVAAFEPVSTQSVRLLIRSAGASKADNIMLQEIEAYSN